MSVACVPKAFDFKEIVSLCAKNLDPRMRKITLGVKKNPMLGSHPNPLIYVVGSRHNKESIKPILIIVSGLNGKRNDCLNHCLNGKIWQGRFEFIISIGNKIIEHRYRLIIVIANGL